MISAFLKAIQGHQFEELFTVTLFTGMREGEALGLLWDCVDLSKGTITVDKQLQLIRGTKGQYQIVPTKNSKSRTITVVISFLVRSNAYDTTFCPLIQFHTSPMYSCSFGIIKTSVRIISVMRSSR